MRWASLERHFVAAASSWKRVSVGSSRIVTEFGPEMLLCRIECTCVDEADLCVLFPIKSYRVSNAMLYEAHVLTEEVLTIAQTMPNTLDAFANNQNAISEGSAAACWWTAGLLGLWLLFLRSRKLTAKFKPEVLVICHHARY
jgi:hypothetical protein